MAPRNAAGLASVGRECDNPDRLRVRPGLARADFVGCLNAVQLRHVHIQQHEVKLPGLAGEQIDGVSSVTGEA